MERSRKLRSFADVVSSGLPGPTNESQNLVDPVSNSHLETSPDIVEPKPPVVIRASDSHSETTSGGPSPSMDQQIYGRRVRAADVVSSRIPRATKDQESAEKTSDSHEVGVSRVERASQEELTAVLEQLTPAARVLNAISLQNGLVDGSISPDAVTAELLNIEAAELELLKNFDRNKVDAFVQKLIAAGPSLVGNDKTLKIEDMIILMNDWRLRYTDLGNLRDTAIADSFSSVVEHTKTMNQVALLELVTAADNARSALNTIPTLDKNNNYDIFLKLGPLEKALGILADGPKTLATLTEGLRKLKNLVDGTSISASPQGKLADLVDDFFLKKDKIDVFPPEDYDALAKLISIVFALVPDAKASEGDLKVIEAITVSRRHFHDRQLTTGFLNGYSDIGMIARDTSDPQLKRILHELNTEILNAGLLPLQSQMTQAAGVDKSWTGLSANSIGATEDVRRVTEKLVTSETRPDKATLLKIDKCTDTPRVTPNFSKDINALIKNSTALPTQLDSLIKLSEQMAESLRGESEELLKLKNAIKFPSDDAKKIAESPTVLAEFKKHSPAKVMVVLEDVQPKLGELKKSFDESNQVIQRSADMKKVVNALLGHPDMKEVVKFFDGLKKHPSEFSSAYLSITLLRDIRKLEKRPRFAKDINELTTSIYDSRVSVETLKRICAEMKGKKASEASEVLAKLGPLTKENHAFGSSVTAVRSIRKVGSKKADLEKFLMDGWKVAPAILKVQDPEMRNRLMMDWGDFAKTKVEVDNLLANLEAKRDKITTPKAQKFADFGPLFRELSGLMNVNFNVVKARGVLEVLASTNSEFAPMMTLVDWLDPSDLHFARFNVPLTEIVGLLANIDQAFANVIVLSPNGGVDATTSTSWVVYGVIGGCVFVFFAGGGASGTYLYYQKVQMARKIKQLPHNSMKLKKVEQKKDHVTLKTSKEPLNVPHESLGAVNLLPTQTTGIYLCANTNRMMFTLGAFYDDIDKYKLIVNNGLVESTCVDKKCDLTSDRIKTLVKIIKKKRVKKTDKKEKERGNEPKLRVFEAPIKQLFEHLAKIDFDTHKQENGAYMSRTRGNHSNFNVNAAPTSNDEFFYHCIRIRLPLFTVKIIAQAPMDETVNVEEEDPRWKQARSQGGADEQDESCQTCPQLFIEFLKSCLPCMGTKLNGDDSDVDSDNDSDNDSDDLEESNDKSTTGDNVVKKSDEERSQTTRTSTGTDENSAGRTMDVDKTVENTKSLLPGMGTKLNGDDSDDGSENDSDVHSDDLEESNDKSTTGDNVGKESDEERSQTARTSTGTDDNSAGRTMDVDKTVENPVEKTVESTVENTVEKPVEKPAEDKTNAGKTTGTVGDDQAPPTGSTVGTKDGKPPMFDPKNFPKVKTEESFWKMVVRNGVYHIVQTCPDKEISDYYPKEEGHPKTFGDYQITCTKRDLEIFTNVTHRKLKIKHTKTLETHDSEHWCFSGWGQGETPWSLVDSIIHVIMETRLTQTPTCVVSKYGTGRAAVYTFIEYFFQVIYDNRVLLPNAKNVLTALRDANALLIENGSQLIFAILATFSYVKLEWSHWIENNSKEDKELFNDEILVANVEVFKNYNNPNWSGHNRHWQQLIENGLPLSRAPSRVLEKKTYSKKHGKRRNKSKKSKSTKSTGQPTPKASNSENNCELPV